MNHRPVDKVGTYDYALSIDNLVAAVINQLRLKDECEMILYKISKQTSKIYQIKKPYTKWQ